MRACVAGWTSWTDDAGTLEPVLLPARQRRRASRSSRMAAHVLGRLAEQERVSPIDLRRETLVFGSCHGEMDVTVALLAMMHEDDGALSPMRFSASVHNAAAGLVTISTENQGFSTTISAGADTVAMTLVEALTLLHEGHPRVLVTLTEEPLPSPFDRERCYGGLAVALELVADGAGPVIELRPPHDPRCPADRVEVPASVRANPLAPALGLVHVLEAGSGRMRLGGDETPAWGVEVLASRGQP